LLLINNVQISMLEMIKNININRYALYSKKEDKKEIPCKDMDIDCLSDSEGSLPFGSYVKCYLYDPDKGNCPFLPILNY